MSTARERTTHAATLPPLAWIATWIQPANLGKHAEAAREELRRLWAEGMRQDKIGRTK